MTNIQCGFGVRGVDVSISSLLLSPILSPISLPSLILSLSVSLSSLTSLLTSSPHSSTTLHLPFINYSSPFSLPNSSPIPSPPHHFSLLLSLQLLTSPSSTTLLPPLSPTTLPPPLSPPLYPTLHLLTQGLNKQHKDIHEMGCVSAAKKWINRNLIPISAVIVGISLLQVWVGV